MEICHLYFHISLLANLNSYFLDGFLEVCIFISRDDPLASLRTPTALIENPPHLRLGSLYNARTFRACAHPHAYPSMPPSLPLLWALLAVAA